MPKTSRDTYTHTETRTRPFHPPATHHQVDAALRHLPHWPSRQADHIFVVEMDRGRCFQSDLNVRDRFGSAMVLMYEGTRTFGRVYEHDEHGIVTGSVRSTNCCFCREHDLVIPPLVSVGRYMAQAHPRALADAFSSRWPHRSFWERRSVLANFRGDPNQSDWRRPNVRRLILQHAASTGLAP